MRLESLRHQVGVTLRLRLVMLERIQDLRVVRRGDHPVEHAEDVLLHRMRLVDVLYELLLECLSHVQPPQRELTDLPTEQRRPAEVLAVPGLELVHEHCERPAVTELQPAHLERHPRELRKLGGAVVAVNPLHAPM